MDGNDRYEDFSDLIPRLKPGYALRQYISPNNPNNTTLHIRAIVDDQLVCATWSNRRQDYIYRVIWLGQVRDWMDDLGWVTPAGKSRCSLPPL